MPYNDDFRPYYINLLRDHVKRNNFEKIRSFVHDPYMRNYAYLDNNLILNYAIAHGYVELALEVLEIATVQQTIGDDNNKIFREAAKYNCSAILRRLLSMNNVRENADAEGNEAFYHVAARGTNNEDLEALLAIPKILEHVIAHVETALIVAGRNRDYDCKAVEILLNIPAVLEALAIAIPSSRILPHIEYCLLKVFRDATNREDLVKMQSFLANRQIRNYAHLGNNLILNHAITYGHVELALDVLSISTVQAVICQGNNRIFRHAAVCNQLDILLQLLNLPGVRVHAHAENNDALCSAARNGNLEMVVTLLEIENVRVNVANSHALFIANIYNPEIAEVLRLAIDGAENLSAATLVVPANITTRQNQIVNPEYNNNEESSMKTLNEAEERLLNKFIKHYKPLLAVHGGVDVVINSLKSKLKEEYNKDPAMLDNGTSLPLTWTEFEELGLRTNMRNEALVKYYQHKIHAAWRYFLPKNNWKDSTYLFTSMYANDRNTYFNWSELNEIVAILYLAMCDDDITTLCDGFTLETRIRQFGTTFEGIGRAHNYDADSYASKGDMPTCHGGTKRRLFQAAQSGHIYGKHLNAEIIKQELTALIHEYYNDRYKQLNDAEKLKVVDLVEENLSVDSSEMIAATLVDELKKAIRNNNTKIADVHKYYIEACKEINPKAKKIVQDLLNKDNADLGKLRAEIYGMNKYSLKWFIASLLYILSIFKSFFGMSAAPKEGNESVSMKLESYDITEEQTNKLLFYFKNKYEGEFTEQEDRIVRQQLESCNNIAKVSESLLFKQPKPFTCA